MTQPRSARLVAALDQIPRLFPGPGGAAAVVKDGAVLEQRTWGYADAETATPFKPSTLFRICSISKQFTCALALTLFPDFEALEAPLAALLPKLSTRPQPLHLCHNQSGLRDYWTVAMMQGSPVEAPFVDRDAARLIAETASLQFEPGQRYSYANQNFRLLSDAIEAASGQGFGDLLRREIFDPCKMPRAILAADAAALPDGGTGYEGDAESGFRPAVNRIRWTGDAGVGASLEDMIAWEIALDRGHADPQSLFSRLTTPVSFADGSPSAYGFGLARGREFGVPVTGHGGALRGWRSHRVYAPTERLSVVVLFNHLSDAHSAALHLLGAALDAPAAAGPARVDPPTWLGAYLDPETGLSARVETAGHGRVRLRFGHAAETLDLEGPDRAAAPGLSLDWAEGGLKLHRSRENLTASLTPLAGSGSNAGSGALTPGRYVCAEISSHLVIEDAGGVLYGGFEGPLGRGRRDLLTPLGGGVHLLPCRRALDHTPPGDFTLAPRPGDPDRLTVGCWLARGLDYQRV